MKTNLHSFFETRCIYTKYTLFQHNITGMVVQPRLTSQLEQISLLQKISRLSGD